MMLRGLLLPGGPRLPVAVGGVAHLFARTRHVRILPDPQAHAAFGAPILALWKVVLLFQVSLEVTPARSRDDDHRCPGSEIHRCVPAGLRAFIETEAIKVTGQFPSSKDCSC